MSLRQRVWPHSFEDTPDYLKHRYFDEKGKRIPNWKLLRIENAWRNSATAHVGFVDFRKSLEPRRPKDIIPGE